jgi:hypothetical protein
MTHHKTSRMPFVFAMAIALRVFAVDGGLAPQHEWKTSFNWDVPRLETIVPVGRALQVGQVPQKIFLARTKMNLADAIEHYAERFLRLGYFIPPKIRAIQGFTLPRVVAFDAETHTSFVVYGWPEADGTTSLVLGASDLSSVKQKRTEKTAEPSVIFPGATDVTQFNLEGTQAVAFSAKATQAELMSYYATVLPTLGYVEVAPGVFSKGPRVLRVLAKHTLNSSQVGVVILEQIETLPMPARPISETAGDRRSQ